MRLLCTAAVVDFGLARCLSRRIRIPDRHDRVDGIGGDPFRDAAGLCCTCSMGCSQPRLLSSVDDGTVGRLPHSRGSLRGEAWCQRPFSAAAHGARAPTVRSRLTTRSRATRPAEQLMSWIISTFYGTGRDLQLCHTARARKQARRCLWCDLQVLGRRFCIAPLLLCGR